MGRIWIIGVICLGCAVAVTVFTYFWQLKAVALADLWMQDRVMQLGRHTPVNGDMVLLGIDDATLALQQDPETQGEHEAVTLMRAPYPYSREVYAMAIERLMEAGARLVVVDILFLGATEADPELRRVLDAYGGQVVIGSILHQELAEGKKGTLITRVNYPSDTLVPHTVPPDRRVGFVNLWPDADGRLRSVYLATTVAELEEREASEASEVSEGEEVHHSLAGSALRAMGREDLLGSGGGPRYFRLTDMGDASSGHLPYAPRSIYGIFDERIWEANFGSGKAFEGKVVFIAPVSAVFQDSHPTAEGELLGAHIHINALAATLAGEFYTRADWRLGLGAIWLGAVAGFVVIGFVTRPVLKLALLFGVGIEYLAVVLAVYDGLDVIVPVVPPVLAGFSGGILAFGFDFAIERRREIRLRRTLERYTSRELVSEILANREDYLESLGGAQREVTVLFSDIRGFTTLTEDLEPAALVEQLNEYLGEMVQSIFGERGTVDKFIGDAIMAVWGSVGSGGAGVDAGRAVSAGLDMCRRLRELNRAWVREGRPVFENGIGINSGEAIFGNIGSAERSDPTVIGDAVNLASRLEGLTKKYRCEIVVSQSVADHAAGQFVLREIDYVRVLGRRLPIAIYSVLGRVGEELIGGGEPPAWNAALAAYRAQEFEDAEKLFTRCGEERPGDYLSELYLKRVRQLRANPPGEGWDGVEVMESK